MIDRKPNDMKAGLKSLTYPLIKNESLLLNKCCLLFVAGAVLLCNMSRTGDD